MKFYQVKTKKIAGTDYHEVHTTCGKTKTTLITTLIASLLIPSICLAKNLPVPFTPQAPDANWGQPWQDACEETAVLIVDYYYAGRKFNRPTARSGIKRILRIKNNSLGWSLDENAEKIAGLINLFLPWEAKLAENPGLEMIKQEIDNQRPVIAPVHGKAMRNPHFANGGPDYHTVVISGYDDQSQEFIVQDPGTRFGLDFRYSYDTIMNALHDFLPGNKTKFGRKVAIFTSKQLTNSADLDGDEDGLSKRDELKYGTIPWLVDSDGDGYSDGMEVAAGYFPTLAEHRLPNGSLIKSAASPKVYLLENNAKRHIVSEEVFLRHGWKWNQIQLVSNKFISRLSSGKNVN